MNRDRAPAESGPATEVVVAVPPSSDEAKADAGAGAPPSGDEGEPVEGEGLDNLFEDGEFDNGPRFGGRLRRRH
jgi:hypothetical protein